MEEGLYNEGARDRILFCYSIFKIVEDNDRRGRCVGLKVETPHGSLAFFCFLFLIIIYIKNPRFKSILSIN